MFTDIRYYIGWAVIAFIPLMIVVIASETIRDKIIASIIVLAVTFGLMCGIYHECSSAIDRWNNGIHIDCGGTYQFSGVAKYRNSASYYYTCDKCGHTEEFQSIMR